MDVMAGAGYFGPAHRRLALVSGRHFRVRVRPDTDYGRLAVALDSDVTGDLQGAAAELSTQLVRPW